MELDAITTSLWRRKKPLLAKCAATHALPLRLALAMTQGKESKVTVPKALRGGTIRHDLFDERRKGCRQTVQPLHIAFIRRQGWKPVVEMVLGISVNGFNRRVFLHDAEYVEGQDFFIAGSSLLLKRWACTHRWVS